MKRICRQVIALRNQQLVRLFILPPFHKSVTGDIGTAQYFGRDTQMPKNWIVTRDEAIEMYARYWTARHGRAGSKRARETASSLLRQGDTDGHEIWNKVADVIERNSSGVTA